MQWLRAKVRAELVAPLALLLALALAGCGGHASRTKEARSALDAGHPKRALQLLNEELGVDKTEQLPKDLHGDNALLILDRAMVLQQLEQYKLSSRDLEVADKAVEVLDLSRNATADLGRYLFSDQSGPYRAPAYEKLMINSMNLVNYLVRGDLDGARIEARRLSVMQKFIDEHEDPGAALIAPGSMLAGFAFEKSGRAQEALRYYDEALKYGRYRTLDEPVRRLAATATYRSPRIRAILGDDDPLLKPAPEPVKTEPDKKSEADKKSDADKKEEAESAKEPEKPAEPALAELFVVVSFGRVPAKIAKRVPIGLALTYASGSMSPHDRAQADRLAAQGLVTWINYPELGKPRGQYDIPEFALDGAWQNLEGILAVDRQAQKAWDKAKGAVIASAITRMITRIVAGEAVRRGTGGGSVGLILGLATQATMVAADTPDTRNWSTLPARIAFGRLWVKPGQHRILLGARSIRKEQIVTLRPGGWALVNLTVLH